MSAVVVFAADGTPLDMDAAARADVAESGRERLAVLRAELARGSRRKQREPAEVVRDLRPVPWLA